MINLEKYKKDISEKVDSFIDLNIKKVLILGESLNIKRNNISILNNNIYTDNIILSKNKYDLIILNHILEKIIDANSFLLNIRKHSNKNSKFIFIVSNLSHLSNIEYMLNGKNTNSSLDYKLLKDTIKNSGFEVISEEVYTYLLDKKNIDSIIKITRNPYITVYSFIIYAKKTELFPFIEGTY